MLYASFPENEINRLEALHSLNILDSQADARFDCITRFAAQKLDVPICLITLIDADRQWFKSAWGVDSTEVPRDISICAHAICDISSNTPSERIYEIANTNDDSRFFDSPLVIRDPWVRSYISFVLQSYAGMNIGTLCLLDTQPRKFDENEKYLIVELGKMVENLINSHPQSIGIGH